MSDMRYINRKVLEALKPMGRIDGDMPVAGANESTTIEAWRRECELLRREIEQLRIANDQFHDERDKWHDEARKAWAQLREQPKASPAAEFNHKVECDNVSLRIIVKHLIGLI
jgi:hypothetical protein